MPILLLIIASRLRLLLIRIRDWMALRLIRLAIRITDLAVVLAPWLAEREGR